MPPTTKRKQKDTNKQTTENKTPHQKLQDIATPPRYRKKNTIFLTPPSNFSMSRNAYFCSQNTWLLYIKYCMCNKHNKDVATNALSICRKVAKDLYVHILSVK